MVQGKKYKGLQASVPREGKSPLVATGGGIPVKRNMEATLEDRPSRLYDNQTELVQRLLAEFCELCGSDKGVEVHHVRAMRKLHEYPGRSKPEWLKRMIALRRKTLVLCKRCHEATEHGLPITWTLIPLKEVKARRKARMTTMLERYGTDCQEANLSKEQQSGHEKSTMPRSPVKAEPLRGHCVSLDRTALAWSERARPD